jgi:glycosyltransferase involved in cell wall biosynthesis
VLATPVAGVPDVVRDGATGVLVSDTAPAAIAAEVTAVLTDDDFAEMSHEARNTIEEQYNVQRAVSRYKNILSKISRR